MPEQGKDGVYIFKAISPDTLEVVEFEIKVPAEIIKKKEETKDSVDTKESVSDIIEKDKAEENIDDMVTEKEKCDNG